MVASAPSVIKSAANGHLLAAISAALAQSASRFSLTGG